MTAAFSLVADRWGRRRVLIASALLMAAAGAVFATTNNYLVLLVAAAVGTLSPSGSEVGPFLSIEQAMLPQTTSDETRTKAFSAYNFFGQAVGALGSGAAAVPALLGAEPLQGYRARSNSKLWPTGANHAHLGKLKFYHRSGVRRDSHHIY